MNSSCAPVVRDKLQVFVSSTIGECAEERQSARKAIVSLNHAAFLFEDAGARPYPPKDLYLPQLYDSDIFVGIYKNSYGWCPDTEIISGLEEEFRHATKRGMPCLLYVHADASERQPKLIALLDDIERQARLTYARYSTPYELYERLRDDIEAVVAQQFIHSDRLERLARTDARSQMVAALRGSEALVPRATVADGILAQLSDNSVVQVTGEPGSGKTTILASIADARGFLFISAAELTPLDFANLLISRLDGECHPDGSHHTTLPAALLELTELWASKPPFTLVVDGLTTSDLLRQVLEHVGGLRGHRLLYSLRTPEAILGHRRFAVPPFSALEVNALAAQCAEISGVRHTGAELETLLTLSQGNPLLLRYCLERSSGEGYHTSLAEYEVARWTTLPARSRELLSYVALSRGALSLVDLVELLLGGAEGPETVLAATTDARWFLTESTHGYSLRHDHQRESIRRLLAETPQRLAFYARRLADLIAKRLDFMGAFEVLNAASDPGALAVARRAAFQGGREGDYRRVLVVLRELERAARKDCDEEDLVIQLLGIAEASQQLGMREDARAALDEATAIAENRRDERLLIRVGESKAWDSVTTSLSFDSFRELQAVRDAYAAQNDEWSVGRVNLELSALSIRLHRYEQGAEEARSALRCFDRVGDAHGISLAKRNLASALSAIQGRAKELDYLLRELRGREGQTQTPRERAWLCNLLVRRLRRSKDYNRAREYAKEALRISEELGDGSLVAMNSLNLGNVYRDEGRLQDAIQQFERAATRGHAVGDREMEARASRITASVYRHLEKLETARHYAAFAVGLLRGTAAVEEFIEALEELGDCYRAADNRSADASKMYLEAALVAREHSDVNEVWRLGEKALGVLSNGPDRKRYISALDALCGSSFAAESGTVHDQLAKQLSSILISITQAHVIDVMGVYFRLLFEDMPAPVAKFLFNYSLETITASTNRKADSWRVLLPLIELMAAAASSGMTLKDTVAIGEAVAAVVSHMYYKPQGNGAAHWVVGLQLHEPVICSLSAVGDRAETAIVCCILALFLKAFEQPIQDRIVESGTVPNREVHIVVACASDLGPEIAEGAHLDANLLCSVTRPTTPQSDDRVPTIVIFKEEIISQLTPGQGCVSNLQQLFARTLLEVIFQFYKGEIELDVLAPKIVGIVRETIS